MLSVDIVLYILLAYYLDNVLPSNNKIELNFNRSTELSNNLLCNSLQPGEYGARRSPWFCLVPSFWCRPTKKFVSGEINNGYDGYNGNATNVSHVLYIHFKICKCLGSFKHKPHHFKFVQPDIEAIPDSLQGKEVLRIRGLTKTFKPFGKPEIKAVRGNYDFRRPR